MTAHDSSSPPPGRRANRLAASTSPYLLQHAYNPVDWYPWGDEALERAAKENKPLLLSIGYSSCHWCHVMERESFEDDGIAALMNADFVCVKVDREERPDLDDIYMAATLAMNHGHGGWPMTVFLTPDQKPFLAGTYFPPEDRFGRPGFRTLLGRIAEAWREDPEGLREQGAKVADFLKENAGARLPGDIDADAFARFEEQSWAEFDSRFGGFGTAPKFPPHQALLVLNRRGASDAESRSRFMAKTTLDAMMSGGIYDHVGGGFARYSTDREWLVPHFEKMLYDNAQLVRAYVEAFQVTGDAACERVARDTLDYVLREMTSNDGAFFSATDADSEGEEGRFFVWTSDEFDATLSKGGLAENEIAAVHEFWGVTDRGNWEGRTILNTRFTIESVARRFKLDEPALAAHLSKARCLLYGERSKRVPPGLDDKVLTSWNGLMIGSMAEAGRVFGDRRYVDAAERAASFLWTAHRQSNGRLLRSSRLSRAQGEAFLEDYAFFAGACVDLYEAGAGGEALAWLERSRDLADLILDLFRSSESEGEGSFFSTSRFNEALLVRPREGHDGATPSANASAALALARLSFHFDRASYRNAAMAAIRAYGDAVARQPRAFPTSLLALRYVEPGPVELAIVGPPDDHRTRALERAVAASFIPERVIARFSGGGAGSADSGTPSHPLLRGKSLVDGAPAVYVCRNYACDLPVTDPDELRRKLKP